VPIDREHRTDSIIVEMNFSCEVLDSGLEVLNLEGRAHPGISSGSRFGASAPRKGSLREQIDKQIESRKRWFAAGYPTRPLNLKITRPDCRQLTLRRRSECSARRSRPLTWSGIPSRVAAADVNIPLMSRGHNHEV